MQAAEDPRGSELWVSPVSDHNAVTRTLGSDGSNASAKALQAVAAERSLPEPRGIALARDFLDDGTVVLIRSAEF